METSKEYRYKRAKEKIEEIKSFYGNLLAYCIIIPFLAWINYNTTSFPWVIFPAIGWGIGLLGHWMNVTGNHPFFGKDWERRKLEELMKRDEF